MLLLAEHRLVSEAFNAFLAQKILDEVVTGCGAGSARHCSGGSGELQKSFRFHFSLLLFGIFMPLNFSGGSLDEFGAADLEINYLLV